MSFFSSVGYYFIYITDLTCQKYNTTFSSVNNTVYNSLIVATT